MRASKLQEWPAMMDQNQNPEDEHSEGGVLPGVRDGTAGVPGIVNTHRATHGREPSNSPSAHFHIRVDVPKPISQIVLSPTQLKIYRHTNITCPSKTAHNEQFLVFITHKKQAKDGNLVKSVLPILMSLF